MKPALLARAVGSRVAFAMAVLTTPVFAAFCGANGASPGTFLLGTACALAVALAVGLRGPTTGRRAWLVIAALALMTLILIVTRVSPTAPSGVQVCHDGVCGGAGGWWQRVFDEQECAQAGLLLTTRGEEGRELKAAFADAYAATPESWRGGPNALLMTSRLGSVESLRFEPPGEGPLPTVIFLHGFGGLLTPYVSTLARELGGRFIIIAPALDNIGVWASDRGQQVLRATLASLPTRADRSRLFLIGLSNGGIGATTALRDPELRRAFAGFVLLSGVGAVPTPLKGAHVLVVSGKDDPRFPFTYVVTQTEALRSAGADTTTLFFPATHALVFTHATEWISGFERWTRQ